MITHEDKKLGYKILKFPDGYMMYELPDGTVVCKNALAITLYKLIVTLFFLKKKVDLSPDGERKTTLSDNTTIETFADGSKKVIQAHGKVRYIPPPHITQVRVSIYIYMHVTRGKKTTNYY